MQNYLSFMQKLTLRYGVPILLSLTLLTALIVVPWDTNVPVAAQLTRYYSSTCEGGWKNVMAAAGEPAVTDGSYTEQNSAVFLDDAAEVRCSGFSGTLPPQTRQSEAYVRFSWHQPGRSPLASPIKNSEPTARDESSESRDEEAVSDAIDSVVDGVNTNDGEAVSDTPSTDTVDTASDVTGNTEIPSEEDGAVPDTIAPAAEEIVTDAETSPELEVVPVTESEPAAPVAPSGDEGTPISWYQWLGLGTTVFADEVVPEDVPQPSNGEDTLLPVESPAEDVVPVATTTNDIADSLTASTSTTTATTTAPYVAPVATANPETAQFLVMYKTLETEWLPLQEVTVVTNDIRIPLPATILASSTDFSEVTIRLVALPQFDRVPPVYLDSIWLEVYYAPTDTLGIHEISPLIPVTYPIRDMVLFTESSTTASSTPELSIIAGTTTEVVSMDVFAASVESVQGIDDRYVLARLRRIDGPELWLFDMGAQTMTRLGFAEGAPGAILPLAKEGLIFWLNQSASKMYTYDTRTAGQLFSMLLVANLPDSTEYTFSFPYTEWKIVWRGNSLFATHPKTGEVFGDGSSESLLRFVRYFPLAEHLSEDELHVLGLTTVTTIPDELPVAE